MKAKIIILTGPTSIGKTELAIKIAKKYKGEIISADSRQIYKGLENFSSAPKIAEQKEIKHHLISFLNPKEKFTSFEFKTKADKLINEITQSGKLPIIVGGTIFYLETLIYQKSYSQVKPNLKLRKELENLDLKNLQERLFKTDPARYKSIDLNNRRRIIRSIEIASFLGQVPPIKKEKNLEYNTLSLCLLASNDLIKKKIEARFKAKEKNIIQEAKEFLKNNTDTEILKEFGLGYNYILDYLNQKIEFTDLKNKLLKEEKQYAKKQKTFLKKINFDAILDIEQGEDKKINQIIDNFLKK